MTVPLVLLAIPAALLGLLVGLPPDGGWIHTFLEPVFFKLEQRVVRLGRRGRRAHAASRWPPCSSASASPT